MLLDANYSDRMNRIVDPQCVIAVCPGQTHLLFVIFKLLAISVPHTSTLGQALEEFAFKNIHMCATLTFDPKALMMI